MLIPFEEVNRILQNHRIRITGIFHIGAHDCEEKTSYNKNGVLDDDIYWVEGNEEKVAMNKAKGIQHIYNALIFDVEKEVDFHITKNNHLPGNHESSSILPLGVHALFYPQIQVQEVRKCFTKTIDTLVHEEHIPIQKLNFWNLDIQGVELQALKGAKDLLRFADAIYIEVNQLPLYKDCALLPEVDYFMQNNGFTRTHIKMAEQGWGDALYIRS